MKVFGIATETHECYGHGDFGKEQRIVRTGSYGSGDFPPLFPSQEAAEKWISEQEYKVGMRVVEVDLRGYQVSE